MGSRYQDSQLYSLLEALTKNTQSLLKTHTHLKITDDYKTIEKLNASLTELHRTYFPKFPGDVWPWTKKDIYNHIKTLRKGFPSHIDSDLMLKYILLIQNLLMQLPEDLPKVVPFIEDSNLNTDIPTKIKLKNVEGQRLVYELNGERRDFNTEYTGELSKRKELFQQLLIDYYLKKESEKIKGPFGTSTEGGISQCIQSLQRLQQREEILQGLSFMTLLDDEKDPVIKKQTMNLFSQMPWITQNLSEQKSNLAEELVIRLKSRYEDERFVLLSKMSPLLSKLIVVDPKNIDAAELEHIKSEIAQVEGFLQNYHCPQAKDEINQITHMLEFLKGQMHTITPKKPSRNLVPEIDAFSEDSLAGDFIAHSNNEVIVAKLRGELEAHSPHNVRAILDYLEALMLEMNLFKIDLSVTSLTKRSILNTTNEIQAQIQKLFPVDLEEFLNLLLNIRHEKIYDYKQISKKCSEIKIDPHQYGLDKIPLKSAQAQLFIEKKIEEISKHQKNPLIDKGRNLISLLAQLRLAADYIDESTAYSELVAANERINNQDLSEGINFALNLTQLETIQSNMEKLIHRHFNTTHDQKYRLHGLFDFSAYHKIMDILTQKLTSMVKPIIATEGNIANMQHELALVTKIIASLDNKNMVRFINNPNNTSDLSELYDSASVKVTQLEQSFRLRAAVVDQVKPLLNQLNIDANTIIENYKQNGEISSIMQKLNTYSYSDARTYSIINKIKVKLLEYERTAPHNLREESDIKVGSIDYGQAILNLKEAIKTIKNQRWTEAYELSMQLNKDLEFFETHYGTKPTAAEYTHFKDLFLARIHSHEVTIRNHRAIWKPILANILIGLFSFGIALGIRLAHTYQKNGTATLFFHKTQKEKDVAEIEKVFAQQAPAA